ncbi:MAG: cytochrome c [Pseudomonas sp.]|nr:cytochrome c [Pseudomonas sp.]
MTRPLTIAACIAVSTAALWATATAQEAAQTPAAPAAAPTATAAETPAAGDAKRGRELAYTCQGCHGVTGYKNAYPNYHVPKIGGQSEAYLNAALLEYRKGTRKHPTMQAQAQSFSEQDIADIAAFLASVK